MKRLIPLLLLTAPLLALTDMQKEFAHAHQYTAAGGGVISTDRNDSGAIGATFGFRGHPNRFGWDVGLDLMAGFDFDAAPVQVILRGLGLFYLTPQNCRSFYVGAGLGVGGRFCIERYEEDCDSYRKVNHQSGAYGEFALGYEWLWFSPIRVRLRQEDGGHFTKADLPIHCFIQFLVHQPATLSASDSSDYSPSLALQLGFGY